MDISIEHRSHRWHIPAQLVLALALAAAPLSAVAAIFTVGPQGEFASLQAAIDTAAGLSGDHDIRIQRGTYLERIHIQLNGQVVVMTGGWTGDFDEQLIDPANTTLSSGFEGRPLTIDGSSGILIASGLTIAGGLVVDGDGGGVLVTLDGPATVVLSEVVLSLNRVSSQLPLSQGTGIAATLRNGASFVLRDCDVNSNHAEPGSRNVIGAVYIAAWNQGFARMQRCRIRNNRTTLTTDGDLPAVTAVAGISASAELELLDNSIHDNPGVHALDNAVRLVTSSRLRFERNTLHGQPGITQVFVLSAMPAPGQAMVRNNLIVGGGIGLFLGSEPVIADHNTIVGFSTTGIMWNGTATWYNNIVYGDGPASNVTPPAGNLTAVDPGFVDAAAGNYRLAVHSPAVDAAVTVPGLPPLDHDLDGRPRPAGSAADIGAFERDETLFADGFDPSG